MLLMRTSHSEVVKTFFWLKIPRFYHFSKGIYIYKERHFKFFPLLKEKFSKIRTFKALKFRHYQGEGKNRHKSLSFLCGDHTCINIRHLYCFVK